MGQKHSSGFSIGVIRSSALQGPISVLMLEQVGVECRLSDKVSPIFLSPRKWRRHENMDMHR